MVDIVASYKRIQFQGKRMIQTQENGKKSHFVPDLGPLGPNSDRQNFFIELVRQLDFVPSYHPMKCEEKRINQTWENSKKPNFGLRLGSFGPNLASKLFFMGFTSSKC